MKMLKPILILTLLLMSLNKSYASEQDVYIAGIAEGFPPYQFKDLDGSITGFDADVIRLVFEKMDVGHKIEQMKWADIIGTLSFTDKLDCVPGMEINNIRKKNFDFTSPYYERKTALFTLATNTTINRLEDLVGKTIAGDKGSYLEAQLESLGIKKNIRIKQTKSKEQSMLLLESGSISAVMAPKEVGFYLANKLNININMVVEAEQGSPVAIAVNKGNEQLLNLLEENLQRLIEDGDIHNLQEQWQKNITTISYIH